MRNFPLVSLAAILCLGLSLHGCGEQTDSSTDATGGDGGGPNGGTSSGGAGRSGGASGGGGHAELSGGSGGTSGGPGGTSGAGGHGGQGGGGKSGGGGKEAGGAGGASGASGGGGKEAGSGKSGGGGKSGASGASGGSGKSAGGGMGESAGTSGGGTSNGGTVGGGASGAGTSGASQGGAGQSDGGASGAGQGGQGDGGGGGDASGKAIGKGAAVSPYLVGQNYWYFTAITENWPLVEASGVTMIRVGGIEFNVTPPKDSEYLDRVKQIRAIGAEPLLQVPRSLSGAQAADLVTLLNVTKGQKVRFWCIGNEPEQNGLGAGEVANYTRTIASAMKAVDPSIQIFAPESAWYNEAILKPLVGGDDDITGKDANGRYYIDGVSFHTYPNPTYLNQFDRGTVVDSGNGFRKNVVNLRKLLDKADSQSGRTGEAKLRWALTEFNITYENPPSNGVEDYAVTSFVNGQFFAEVFGIGMEYGAQFVAPWSVLEDGKGGKYDLGYLDNLGGVTRPRSSYWHLQLVAQYFRGHHAAGTTNQPLVKAYGAGDGAQLAVMILNEELAKPYHFTLHLDAAAPPSNDPLDIHVDSGLTGETSGDIGAQATVVLLFDDQGKLTRRLDYSLTDAMAWVPPH